MRKPYLTPEEEIFAINSMNLLADSAKGQPISKSTVFLVNQKLLKNN